MNTVSNKNVWAVLPLKGLQGAKKRLSDILSPEERTGLVKAMAHDVLNALTSANSLAGVLVISNDEEIKSLAANYPAITIQEGEEKGLSGAISHAAAYLASRGIDTMMVIHGDIPLVSADDINHIVNASLPAPSVTIAPCRQTDGTNVMVCSPPEVIAFHYGKNSFPQHKKAACEKGIKPVEFLNNRLALDIDTSGDLRYLLDQLDKGIIGEKTAAYLHTLNLAERLN